MKSFDIYVAMRALLEAPATSILTRLQMQPRPKTGCNSRPAIL